jgi:hypothetical protein
MDRKEAIAKPTDQIWFAQCNQYVLRFDKRHLHIKGKKKHTHAKPMNKSSSPCFLLLVIQTYPRRNMTEAFGDASQSIVERARRQ